MQYICLPPQSLASRVGYFLANAITAPVVIIFLILLIVFTGIITAGLSMEEDKSYQEAA